MLKNKDTQKKQKIVIGVDGNEANLETRVGVNNYAYEVLRNIAILEDEWKDRISFVIYLKNPPLPHMPKSRKGFSYKVLPGGGMWVLKVLTLYLLKNPDSVDVFWTPSHYLPPVSRMPMVCSVMDLGYLEFSEQFKKYDFWQLKLWSAWSFKISKKIIAISDTTNKDIQKHYPNTKNKVVTTLLGYDEHKYTPKVNKRAITTTNTKYSIGSDEYVLFLSTLKPSKNIEGLLKAWQLIAPKHKNTKLVVAGKKGWLFDSIFHTVEKLSLQKSVVFTDFVAEQDKPALIAGAKVFVLPSFWEGFGLDVVSAMACGVPVVVSDRGSLPEVVGDAGIVVNPDSPEQIAAGVEKVLSSTTKEYKKLMDQGLKRAKMFNWKKTARETILALESAIN